MDVYGYRCDCMRITAAYHDRNMVKGSRFLYGRRSGRRKWQPDFDRYILYPFLLLCKRKDYSNDSGGADESGRMYIFEDPHQNKEENSQQYGF